MPINSALSVKFVPEHGGRRKGFIETDLSVDSNTFLEVCLELKTPQLSGRLIVQIPGVQFVVLHH